MKEITSDLLKATKKFSCVHGTAHRQHKQLVACQICQQSHQTGFAT